MELPEIDVDFGLFPKAKALALVTDSNVDRLYGDAAARRLGWLLDAFGAGAPNRLASYCASLASEPSFLSPTSARTGKLDAKWRIVVNEEVDPDI